MGLDKHIGIDKVLKKLKKQKVIISVAISPDRILLLDELVDKKVFRNRSEAVVAAIDDLLSQHFPEYYEEQGWFEVEDIEMGDEYERETINHR